MERMIFDEIEERDTVPIGTGIGIGIGTGSCDDDIGEEEEQ